MSDQPQPYLGSRIILVLAGTVVVIAGLRAAAPILLPFSLALFLAVLVLPLAHWMKTRGVPGPVATSISVLLEVGVLAILLYLASQSIPAFQEAYPRYEARLQILFNSWLDRARGIGVPVDNLIFSDVVNASNLFSLAGATFSRLASLFSYAFLVLLLMIFVLQEASVFPRKLRRALGSTGMDLDRFGKMVQDVQRYLGIKTVISLATGLLLGLWCWIMDLDFPILLGLLAFVLNFIPTIGSIIAGVPAVLLALILHGLGHSLVVAAGYFTVNTIFGNIVEPNLMGRRLGLSTLVVILSLVFWGWVWGPVGMILSVPLTMVLKIWVENTEDFRWIGILLDKRVPDLAAAGPLPSNPLASPGPAGPVEPRDPPGDGPGPSPHPLSTG